MTVLDDARFLASHSEFETWAEGRKSLRMEYFYREMRRKTNLLMDGTAPAGGQWNFDHDNRKPAPDDIAYAGPLAFTPDAVTQEVLDLVQASFPSHFGTLDGFSFATTRADALRALDQTRPIQYERFPDPSAIEKESDKKDFAKLFGEYLRVENVLQNYDEFASLKAMQSLDMKDAEAVEAFKAEHYLDDEKMAELQTIRLPAERKIQDYRSSYNDIRDWQRRQKSAEEKEKSTIDWDDVVFEIDLLKSQEINLDYILELIFEHNKKTKSKADLVDEVRRVIRASLGNRAKESLVVDFINQTDLDQIGEKSSVIEAFFSFAQVEQQREAEELISAESLNAEEARRYIISSLKREYASDAGTELNTILPKMSPLNPQYLTKKQSVFQKIAAFVEKFKGVGGKV